MGGACLEGNRDELNEFDFSRVSAKDFFHRAHDIYRAVAAYGARLFKSSGTTIIVLVGCH
jgi:hypothetical protein